MSSLGHCQFYFDSAAWCFNPHQPDSWCSHPSPCPADGRPTPALLLVLSWGQATPPPLPLTWLHLGLCRRLPRPARCLSVLSASPVYSWFLSAIKRRGANTGSQASPSQSLGSCLPPFNPPPTLWVTQGFPGTDTKCLQVFIHRHTSETRHVPFQTPRWSKSRNKEKHTNCLAPRWT